MPKLVKKSQNIINSAQATKIEDILQMVRPVPDEWLSQTQKAMQEGSVTPIPCTSYQEVIDAWKNAMKWTEGLERALSIMLASILSTMTKGDQLWIKVIGPASCGKSTLCEAVSVARGYVVAKSTIRGFFSGFKEGKSDEDNSLINLIRGMTLVTKDGDTLLQSPNIGQILSEARDVYDRTSRTHYRNKMSQDYEGVAMTWILCGTNSLRALDQSELGERFLDCVIMEEIDDETEDQILEIVTDRAERNLNEIGDGGQDQDLIYAMQLTGGYICYLREHTLEILQAVEMDEAARKKCARYGKFVAHARARPSSKQTETVEREFAARLAIQHTRLAKCLAGVMNKSKVDGEVMRRVRRTALDTSRGQVLEILKQLSLTKNMGMEAKSLALHVNRADAEIRTMLRFLKAIGVVEPFSSAKKGLRAVAKWRMTERMHKLYRDTYSNKGLTRVEET